MTTKICGCTAETCGCCEGIQILTPLPTANRPGLSALNYRVGTQGAFLETMKARLTTMTVDVPTTDGQTIQTFAPLRDLTTRDSSDFAIALLDGWATIADVLTFYQERIANEGYLRTATERRSVLELARLVGYALRPGVAATVYLAYTIQEDQSVTPPKPVSTTIPKGSRSQSVPDVGELPQSFETSDDLEARSDWNNLQVRLTQPQNIKLDNALAIPSIVGEVTPADKIFVGGTDTKVKAGDHLLLVFGDPSRQASELTRSNNPSSPENGETYVLRTVHSVEAQFDRNRTVIQFRAVSAAIVAATRVLAKFVATTKSLVTSTTSYTGLLILEYAQTILTQTYLGGYPDKRPTPAGSWIDKAPVPNNFSGMFAVSDGTYVYLGGGWNGTAAQNIVQRYDPVADSWELLVNLPDSRYRSQAVYDKDSGDSGKIYYIGGRGGATNATQIYDIATNTWSENDPVPAIPVALSDMATLLVDGHIYIAGGNDGGGAVQTLYVCNMGIGGPASWTTRAPLPHALYAPGFGAMNGKLYIAGGNDGTNELNTLYIYDIASDTWTTGANVPTAVTGPGSTVFCGKLYLFGGGSPTRTNITQIYDPVSDAWSTGPNLNISRLWFYGAAVDDTTIVAPGGEAQDGTPVAANEQFNCDSTPRPAPTPDTWEEFIGGGLDVGQLEQEILDAFNKFKQQLDNILNAPPSPPPGVTDPSKFLTPLLLAQNVQPATSRHLARSLSTAFSAKADASAQLLVKFAPRLSTTFYTALANATVNSAPSSLKGIFALGVEAPLFGTSVPNMVTYDSKNKVNTPDQWPPWPIDSNDKDGTSLFLDQAYDAVQAGYVVVQNNSVYSVKQASTVLTVQRAAYGISGKTTQLTLTQAWNIGIFATIDDLSSLRPLLVRAQSEELTLVEEDISDVDVQGQEIPLDNLYDSLSSGRWMTVSGERTDIPGVTGVQASELLMVSGVRQDFDQTLPGDKTRTTVLLATPMAYSYKRDTVMICGNVVKATHGETRNETLGNGDGSQALQSFTLKQSPLTLVAASNPTGVDSTLEVFVNDVQWQEVDTLVGLGTKDRKFITKTDDDDNTSVIFGNGENGARLPTGMANVKSIYRNGIGKPGNVKAGQISLLQTRPLGVQSVVNPLPATGGADRENLDQARENAPLGVMSLDRLVSVQDYADFTRTFAGIGKAAARKLSDSKRQVVHVTIAGVDDIPIDANSDLYQNLVATLWQFGDPDLPVQVDLRELVVLVLSAKVRLATDYQWDPVVATIRATLLDSFGFQNRALGQAAWFSEVISLIQNTAGVEYVEVDAFGGIPETMVQSGGARQVLSPDQIAQRVQQIRSQKSPVSRVDANLADFESGALWPAQLAIFTDAVQDTLILNQIK